MSSLYQDYPVVARRVKSIWNDYWGVTSSYLSLRAQKLTTNVDFIARDNVLEVALGLM